MKLRDALSELDSHSFDDVRAYKMLDVEVVEDNTYPVRKAWIGKEKHVYNWVALVNGYAVGFNENPSRGWSFPVVKVK